MITISFEPEIMKMKLVKWLLRSIWFGSNIDANVDDLVSARIAQSILATDRFVTLLWFTAQIVS